MGKQKAGGTPRVFPASGPRSTQLDGGAAGTGMGACLLLALAATFLTACSSEEALHSSPPCPAGQHQECAGDEDSVRCACVDDGAEDGSGGTDAGDAGTD
jgi:hypothetical protein